MAEPEKSKNTFNSGQSQRIKVEVKRSGGTCEPLSKNLIFELIKTYKPSVNFTNILRAAFAPVDPNSVKRY